MDVLLRTQEMRMAMLDALTTDGHPPSTSEGMELALKIADSADKQVLALAKLEVAKDANTNQRDVGRLMIEVLKNARKANTRTSDYEPTMPDEIDNIQLEFVRDESNIGMQTITLEEIMGAPAE